MTTTSISIDRLRYYFRQRQNAWAAVRAATDRIKAIRSGELAALSMSLSHSVGSAPAITAAHRARHEAEHADRYKKVRAELAREEEALRVAREEAELAGRLWSSVSAHAVQVLGSIPDEFRILD